MLGIEGKECGEGLLSSGEVCRRPGKRSTETCRQNAEAGEDQASGAPGLICLQDTHLTILKCPTLFSFPRQRGWKLLP